jgi:outer membrane protein insertion porin family
LGYYEDIVPAMPRGSTDNKIDLNIDVKEKPTGTFTIGAGFSSADKFLFNAEISKDNFLGLGLRGQISAQLSGRRQLFNVGLTEPHLLDSPYLVSVNGFRTDVEYTSFDRSSFGGEIQLGRNLWELISGSVAYRLEDVSIGNIDPSLSAFFQDGITSSVTFAISRDARDNRLFPKKGTFNSLSLETAGGALGGDNEFFKARLNSRFYYPIFMDVIFRAQGQLGYIGSITGKPPPIFERFFLGGINSIRGYESRSIGSTRQVATLDPTSGDLEFIIGGNKELVFNTEIGFPIVPAVNIQGVFFFDAGNTFDNGEHIDITDLRTSAGMGVRWLSPLGPLRFEYGFPLNAKPGDRKSPFEFTIGTSF